jgi:hypothetical protein
VVSPIFDSDTTFEAAVAELRKSNGHNPTFASAFAYPPVWSTIEINLNTTDTSNAGDALQGRPNDYINELNKIGVSVLAVDWLTCSNFAFSTSRPT